MAVSKQTTAQKKRAMAKAMKVGLGNISAACEAVGITRQTHYTWLKKDKKYKQSVEDIGELTIDFVETQLLKNIKAGKEASAIFFLKTKAKSRGYIETNHTITTEVPMGSLTEATEEELLEILGRKPEDDYIIPDE